MFDRNKGRFKSSAPCDLVSDLIHKMVTPSHRYAYPSKSALRPITQLGTYQYQLHGYWPGASQYQAGYLMDMGTNTGIMGDPAALPSVIPQTPKTPGDRPPWTTQPTPYTPNTYTPFTSYAPSPWMSSSQFPMGGYTPFPSTPAALNYPVTPITPSGLIAPIGYIAAPSCPTPWTPSAFYFPQQSLPDSHSIAFEESLVGNGADITSPRIKWDIACMPSATAKRVSCRGLFETPIWEKVASEPGLERLFITCNGDMGKWMDAWGPITIIKDPPTSPHTPQPKITIQDILDAIYHYFQKPLTARDVERLQALSPSNYVALRNAFWKRIHFVNTGGIKEVEVSKGIRRVDCLGDWRGFHGVRPERVVVGDDEGVRWKLVLSFDKVDI